MLNHCGTIDYVLRQDADKSYNRVIVFDKKPVRTINVCYLDEYAEICGVAYALAYDFWGKGIASGNDLQFGLFREELQPDAQL